MSGASDPQVRERLEALLKLYEATRTEAGAILGNLQGLVAAREAQTAIVGDSEALRMGLEKLQSALSGQTGLGGLQLIALLVRLHLHCCVRAVWPLFNCKTAVSANWLPKPSDCTRWTWSRKPSA